MRIENIFFHSIENNNISQNKLFIPLFSSSPQSKEPEHEQLPSTEKQIKKQIRSHLSLPLEHFFNPNAKAEATGLDELKDIGGGQRQKVSDNRMPDTASRRKDIQ